MTRKFTFLLMALLALAGFKSWGQETITVQIGEGANYTYNLPFNSYYGYSYNEMLFKASEINDAAQSTISSGTINSISFQAYWGNGGTTSFSYDIYMKNVDRTDYNDDGWATVSESDKVKSGTITSSVNDWVELALDSPFQWDGTKNLLIVFDADNLGKYVKTNFYYDYPGFNCCHTVYSDSYNYEPSSSYPTDGNMSVTSYRPNIKLNMDVVTATTYAIKLTQLDVAVGTISANPTQAIAGTAVTLSANLNLGYEFVKWTVINSTTFEEITVTNNQFSMPDSDVTVSATFNSLTQHAIIVIQPDNQEEVGTFTADPTQAYKDERINLSYNLKQYDDYGYKFTGWTVYKTDDPTTTVSVIPDWGSSYHFTMPDYPVTVSAEYEQETYYALTINAENGDVHAYPSEHITAGTMVQLNQYPDAGYDFGGWDVYYTENPDNKITVEYDQFEMPTAAVTVSATFTAKELCTVSIGTIENGTVSLIDAPAENKYYEGQQVKFNVTPDAGYMIDEVTYICDQTINIWYDSFWGYYYFNMPEAPVTINASFIMGITIHDGTDYSENTPILGSYTDVFNTKSQFIFPAAELTAVKDTKITDLIFYTQNVGSNNFSYMTWDIFMKEVDYITPSSFANWNDMTNVYNGTITISNNKLTIHLSTPFEYNGGNLMIGFRENEYGATYFYTPWSGDFSNYDVYHSIATNTSGQPEQSCFLPKTTIIYEPIMKYDITLTPLGDEVGTIQALANGVEVVGQVSEGTEITLQYNFNLGYRFLNWIVNGEPIQGNTFTMPATAVTVAVNYETLTPYAISCATIEHGEILAQFQGATITEAYEGMQIDLVANLDEGYAVTDWTVNGQPIEGSSFIMPAINVNVNATVIQRLEFTVYEDGTATNSNVPIYGLYADYYRTQSEFIIPKEDLTALKDAQITGMTFYSSNIENHDFGLPYWKVFVKEVNKTNASIPYEDETTMTEVYLGTMKVQGYELTVSFASPITYTGNNLMIMFDQQSNSAEFKSINWYGITTASNTALASNFNNFYEDDYFQFLPKTTFAYIPAPQYEVTLSDVENGTIGADPMEAAAGATIQLTATPAEHYRFGSWTTTPEVEIDENNQFVMPEGGVTVSATFLPLSQYQINFMANGVTDGSQTYEEGATIDKVPTEVPSGMTFAGWVAEDIATFTEQAPVYTTTANQAMTLYAVFSYTDDNGGIVWNKVTDVTTLANNDQIIIASEAENMILCQRVQDGLTCQAEAVNIENGQIANISDNAIVFTLESSTENQWHLKYNDNFDGNTSIAALNTYLAPVTSYPTFNNEWVISGNGIQNVGDNSYISYISYEEWSLFYFGTDYVAANAAQLYKKGIGSKTYYMTEVFFVTEDMSVTEDMTKKNIAIVNDATLTIKADATLNATGLCLNTSHDATKLVVEDGGQLIHNNAGTVATFEKNIIGYNSKGSDGWYFIANPTANPTVNLSGGNSYDLYTFNPAAAVEWQNEQYENNVQIPENEIAISRETGYLYANSQDFTLRFAGELIPSGEETIDLVYAGEGQGLDCPGFNLIGNPFPCTAYISSNFDIYKLLNGSEVQISEERTVVPCEAFFVEATEVDETVTLSTTAPTEKSRIMPIVVNSDSGETLDRAILHLEGTRNSHKFMMNPDRTNISFAKNGERFASVSRGDETEIPMNFTADHKGSYTISFNTENFEEEYLHLIDVVSGDNIDLLVTPSYTFEADADEYASRFRIVFGTTDINDDPATSSEPFVYISNGNLVINNVEGTASMQIVDMLGRIVRTETVCGSYNKPHNLKAGAYVITLDGRAQRIVIE